MVTVTCEGKDVVRLEGELDIYAVRDAHAALVPALEGDGPLRLDLAKLEAVDGAGVQLVFWLRRALAARARDLLVEGVTGAVAGQLEFCRFTGGAAC